MSLTRSIRALRVSICPEALAHCDTADGPAATDGRRALETGNVNLALKWVGVEAAAELSDVFAKASVVRKLGPQAAELADRLFLETLIRLHRMGEGMGFTGIRPSGTRVDPVVLAADRALEVGDDRALMDLVPRERREGLHHLFEVALTKKSFDVDDLAAARGFVTAYVRYFKFAEGEDDAHGREEHDGAVEHHRLHVP